MAHEPSDAVNVGVELPGTRIRFPDPARSSQSSSLSKATSLGLGLPSTRRQPISQDNNLPAAYRNDDRRRRVRSAQGASFGDVSTPPASRRRASMVDGKGADGVRPRRVTTSNPPFAGIDEVEPNVFSDEYDLYPKILEEVQHALKLKMRREARQRAPLVTAPSKSTISTAPSSQFQPKIPGPSFSRITKTKVESELDFSPSISIHNLHPVPISFNDGHTLDWSWPEDSEDTSEKRWPISLPKRKTRDRPPPTPSKEFLDRQQARWTERLATIKGSAAPRTLRKADITRTQLERRYRALYPSLSSGKEPLNPVRVVSWYSKLDAPIQTSLDDAEPYTWLRHLRDRHFARTGRRLPWHMSAHLVEEFLEHPHRHGAMFAIPENSLPPSSLAYPSSPAARSFESTSEVSPYKHLTTSSLNRVSLDGNVSFEPFVDYPGRRSGGEESRRSFEGVARHRRRPTLESPGSSLYSASSQPELAPSPSSSRARMRGLPILSRAHDSDDLASPHQSMSEDSDGGKKRKKRNIRLRPTGLDFTSIPKPLPEVYSGEEDDVLSREPSLLDVPVAPKSPMMTAKAQGESFPTSASTEAAVSRPQFQPRTSSARVLRLRGYRNSLPSSQPDSTNEGRWQQYVDEEAMYLEYERRRQIFQDLATQNVENRYVLHRVQDSVLEYQRVMSRISKNLQVPYTPLPQEFVDELGHDPAVILGHTTKWKHYQAVDAMHHALLKQRATLEKYLQQRDIGVMRLPEGSVMTAWIEDVNRSLIEIEKEQPTISEKTKEVSEMLDRVRKLHAAVKAEYHETVTHTSAVYPEMSQIITLEDRYKNRYQQLWGIAMDFVTFMLDAVIPFWRNYGKVIGVDVQDFLIIPLYRNEFTGEAKRYPIVKLPRRSFRHWVALTLIFCGNIALWYFQARGVWVSCRRYRIPLLVKPTFWVLTIPLYCMFVGIQVFFVFLEATGLSLHLVVILWWLAWWASLVS